MFNRLPSYPHRIRVRIQPFLHGFDYVLMLPPGDAAFLGGRALGLDGATRARAGPVSIERHAPFHCLEPILQLLTGRAAIRVLLGHVDEVFLAEPTGRSLLLRS